MVEMAVNWKVLGERLHIARRRHGWTSAELAQKVGTSRVTIYGGKTCASLSCPLRYSGGLRWCFRYRSTGSGPQGR